MKTVLIDCDGVLCDFVGGLCTVLQRHDFNVAPEDFKHWELARSLSPHAAEATQDIVSEPGFCDSLRPYDDALALLDGLETLGFDNILCVTAPWNSETGMRERENWLQEHLDFERHEIIFASGKVKPFVKGDVLIEDHPGTCAAWLDANPESFAYLMDRPWNRPSAEEYVAHPRMQRVFGVASLLEFLKVLCGTKEVAR